MIAPGMVTGGSRDQRNAGRRVARNGDNGEETRSRLRSTRKGKDRERDRRGLGDESSEIGSMNLQPQDQDGG